MKFVYVGPADAVLPSCPGLASGDAILAFSFARESCRVFSVCEDETLDSATWRPFARKKHSAGSLPQTPQPPVPRQTCVLGRAWCV